MYVRSMTILKIADFHTMVLSLFQRVLLLLLKIMIVMVGMATTMTTMAMMMMRRSTHR